MGPEHTGTAKGHDGSIKKNNKGMFLDDVYSNRAYSNVLKFNRKIYEIKLNEPSIILNLLCNSNKDNTLVSYYENETHYKSHQDNSVLTAMTYLYKQPKVFKGGNLILPEYGYQFEPWFNRTYIIPGVVEHEVTEVIMNVNDCGKGLGRYCISNFIHKDSNR